MTGGITIQDMEFIATSKLFISITQEMIQSLPSCQQHSLLLYCMRKRRRTFIEHHNRDRLNATPKKPSLAASCKRAILYFLKNNEDIQRYPFFLNWMAKSSFSTGFLAIHDIGAANVFVSMEADDESLQYSGFETLPLLHCEFIMGLTINNIFTTELLSLLDPGHQVAIRQQHYASVDLALHKGKTRRLPPRFSSQTRNQKIQTLKCFPQLQDPGFCKYFLEKHGHFATSKAPDTCIFPCHIIKGALDHSVVHGIECENGLGVPKIDGPITDYAEFHGTQDNSVLRSSIPSDNGSGITKLDVPDLATMPDVDASFDSAEIDEEIGRLYDPLVFRSDNGLGIQKLDDPIRDWVTLPELEASLLDSESETDGFETWMQQDFPNINIDHGDLVFAV